MSTRPDTYILALEAIKNNVASELSMTKNLLGECINIKNDVNYSAVATDLEKSNIDALLNGLKNFNLFLSSIVWK